MAGRIVRALNSIKLLRESLAFKMWPPLPDTEIDRTPAPLEFRGVGKNYKGLEILRGLDLTVEPGTTVGLVGTNGAGKTTLIKCLLDFCHLDHGSISIFGVDHRKLSARVRLAYLPEHFQAPAYLTGERFLHSLLKLHGRAYESGQALDMFARLGLKQDALHQRVRTYSKGMSQKLGLALCLLADKPLLVLDEPMSGLDPKARYLFKQQVFEQKSQGRTIFFSTHLLNDVENLCDIIAILDQGKLQFVGTPEQCCQTYAADNLETAYMHCIDQLVPSVDHEQTKQLESAA